MKLSNCCSSPIVVDYLNNKRCSFCLLKCTIHHTNRLFYILFFISLISVGYSINAKAPINYKFLGNKESFKNENRDVELSRDSVFQEMLRDSVLFPEYALKSSIYETNEFKSTLCIKYNNLFGCIWINSPFQDGYIQVGKMRFATYKTRKRSILDYHRLQRLYGLDMDSKFSDNPQYTSTIKLIK